MSISSWCLSYLSIWLLSKFKVYRFVIAYMVHSSILSLFCLFHLDVPYLIFWGFSHFLFGFGFFVFWFSFSFILIYFLTFLLFSQVIVNLLIFDSEFPSVSSIFTEKSQCLTDAGHIPIKFHLNPKKKMGWKDRKRTTRKARKKSGYESRRQITTQSNNQPFWHVIMHELALVGGCHLAHLLPIDKLGRDADEPSPLKMLIDMSPKWEHPP